MHRFLGAGIAIAAIMGATTAAAQDYSLNPNYGEVRLSSGFSPDPYTVSVTAGGSIDAAKLGSPCTGQISNAPDVQVNYSPGSLPLIFRTASDSDTTLIVNAPDGQWYCDDDGYTDLGAEVRFNSPRSGNYDVWIGTFGGGTAAATLYVTELNSGSGGNNSSGTINSGLTATYGEVRLNKPASGVYDIWVGTFGSSTASATLLITEVP